MSETRKVERTAEMQVAGFDLRVCLFATRRGNRVLGCVGVQHPLLRQVKVISPVKSVHTQARDIANVMTSRGVPIGLDPREWPDVYTWLVARIPQALGQLSKFTRGAAQEWRNAA